MSLIKQEEQVVYVEPNAMDDITLYNTKNGKVYKSLPFFAFKMLNITRHICKKNI